jgi:hypothetical protein
MFGERIFGSCHDLIEVVVRMTEKDHDDLRITGGIPAEIRA